MGRNCFCKNNNQFQKSCRNIPLKKYLENSHIFVFPDLSARNRESSNFTKSFFALAHTNKKIEIFHIFCFES